MVRLHFGLGCKRSHSVVMTAPAMVLVVGVDNLPACDSLADDLQAGIRKVLVSGEYLDVWPLATVDPVLQATLSAGSSPDIARSLARIPAGPASPNRPAREVPL